MDATVADFTDLEQELVAELLQQRYGKPVGLELADSEMQLDPASNAMTVCPTLYWSERGAHFVVFKLTRGRFRCQFFYSDTDHYGTGHDGYTDLRRCVLTLLRVQADHESQRAGLVSGVNGVAVGHDPLDDAYQGPLVI